MSQFGRCLSNCVFTSVGDSSVDVFLCVYLYMSQFGRCLSNCVFTSVGDSSVDVFLTVYLSLYVTVRSMSF